MADMLPKSSRLDMSNYTASATITSQWNGNISGTFGNGHFNDIAPQDLAYYNGFGPMYYPEAPPQVDFRRGQLMREETYDSVGKMIRSVRNSYSEIYHENIWIRGFKFFRTLSGFSETPGNGWFPSVSDPIFADAMTYYKLHTGISHPVSTTTIEYKDGKSFTTVAYYKYESGNHTLKTQDSTVNSTGDAIVNKTYYSFDYANNATTDNVFGKMAARNILLPIATRTY